MHGVFIQLYLLASSFVLGNPTNNDVSRISVTKCDEYKEIYRYRLESPFPALFGFNEDAGDRRRCPRFIIPVIVGGNLVAVSDEFPHMKSLQYKNSDGSFSHGCGAALISEQYLLTAAHCFDDDSFPLGRKFPDKVIMGDTSLAGNNRHKRRKEMSIAKIIIHPKYNAKNSRYHNIALIKLNSTIRLTPQPRPAIRPACLAQPDQLSHLTTGFAVGWGKINEHHELENLLPPVDVRVEENTSCQEAYSKSDCFHLKFPQGLTSDVICGGTHKKHSYKGDSGSPLTINPVADLPCMNYIVGITSLGPNNCGNGTPGIYTRVDKYIDWIEDNVWKDS